MDNLLAALGLPVGLALGLLFSFLGSRRKLLPQERPAEKPPPRRVSPARAAAPAKPPERRPEAKVEPPDSAFVNLFVDFLSFVLFRRTPGAALHRRHGEAPPRRTPNGFRPLGPRIGPSAATRDGPASVQGREHVSQGALCWQCGRALAVGDHTHGG